MTVNPPPGPFIVMPVVDARDTGMEIASWPRSAGVIRGILFAGLTLDLNSPSYNQIGATPQLPSYKTKKWLAP